jgi:uncharacterized protein (DUF488 family)
MELLQAHKITRLIDIRTIPKSRHNPQYTDTNLQTSLLDAGISYLYLKQLGGLRPKSPDSVNQGWRNQSFRNYADYMQADDFTEGINKLMRLANKETSAIMCAEAVPWRCHRSLVGDALLIRGVKILDIISSTSTKEHSLTSFASVRGTTVTYPAYES